MSVCAAGETRETVTIVTNARDNEMFVAPVEYIFHADGKLGRATTTKMDDDSPVIYGLEFNVSFFLFFSPIVFKFALNDQAMTQLRNVITFA